VCVCVGGGVAVDVSKAVSSNETSRHMKRMKGDGASGERVVECIHARALAFAVSVVAAASIICWGACDRRLGDAHDFNGVWFAILRISMYGGVAGFLSMSRCFLYVYCFVSP